MKLIRLRILIPFYLILFYGNPVAAQTFSPVWVASAPAYPFAMCPAHTSGWVATGLLLIDKEGDLAYWLARFDTNGTMLWQQLLDTDEGVSFSSITPTSAGYVAGGLGVDSFFSGWHQSDTALNDAALATFDTNGNLLWGQCYGGSQDDELAQVIATHDGGYAFVGTTSSSDGDIHDYKNPGTNPMDVWIEKVDSLGRIEWERTYGGSNIDQGIGIAELPDHSFGVLANTRSGDGDVSHYFGEYDIWLLRIDSVGKKLWDETFGSSLTDAATGIAATSDGAMLIVGQRNFLDSTGAELPKLWVAKIDTGGRTLWELGDTIWRNYLPTTMSKTPADGLLIAGNIPHTQQPATPFMVLLDSNGALQWRDTASIGFGFETPFVNSVLLAPDGGFVTAGTGDYEAVQTEGFVALFASPPLAVRVPKESSTIQVFPSPAMSFVTIRTPSKTEAWHGVLYNALGVPVLPFTVVPGESRLDVSRLPRGAYYIEGYSSTGVIHFAILLQ